MAMGSSQRLTFIIMSIFTAVMLVGYGVLLVTKRPCEHFSGTSNFEVAKYKGSWYELKRDKANFFETGECVTAEYGDDGSYVSVKNTEYFPKTDKKSDILGYAVANTWTKGLIGVVFGGGFLADYRVMATDHTSYAIVYSCTAFGPYRAQENVWLLGRNKLEENSADWTALLAIVDPLFKKLLPHWDYAKNMKVV